LQYRRVAPGLQSGILPAVRFAVIHYFTDFVFDGKKETPHQASSAGP
jgi:hypothetical protein